MSRRNAVEGVTGNLKSTFTNADRGYARVSGTENGVPGTLTFACHLRGHFAYGMHGTVVIR